MEESAIGLAQNLDSHLEEILGKIRRKVTQIKVTHIPYYPGISTNFIFLIYYLNHGNL